LIQHHRFRTWRAADIAQADEADGYRVHHVQRPKGTCGCSMFRQQPPKAVPNYTKDSKNPPDSHQDYRPGRFPMRGGFYFVPSFLKQRRPNCAAPRRCHLCRPVRTRSRERTLRSRWPHCARAALIRHSMRDVRRNRSSPVPAARSSQRASKSIFSFSCDAPSLVRWTDGPTPGHRNCKG
jgi:hypothetical protein